MKVIKVTGNLSISCHYWVPTRSFGCRAFVNVKELKSRPELPDPYRPRAQSQPLPWEPPYWAGGASSQGPGPWGGHPCPIVPSARAVTPPGPLIPRTGMNLASGNPGMLS